MVSRWNIKNRLIAGVLTAVLVPMSMLLVHAHPAFASSSDQFSCHDGFAIKNVQTGSYWNDDRGSEGVYDQSKIYNTYKICHDLSVHTGGFEVYVIISDRDNKYVHVGSGGYLYANDANHDTTAQYAITCSGLNFQIFSGLNSPLPQPVSDNGPGTEVYGYQGQEYNTWSATSLYGDGTVCT